MNAKVLLHRGDGSRSAVGGFEPFNFWQQVYDQEYCHIFENGGLLVLRIWGPTLLLPLFKPKTGGHRKIAPLIASPPPTLVPNGVKVAVKQNMEGHEIW